jgi:hypothetical protein
MFRQRLMIRILGLGEAHVEGLFALIVLISLVLLAVAWSMFGQTR